MVRRNARDFGSVRRSVRRSVRHSARWCGQGIRNITNDVALDHPSERCGSQPPYRTIPNELTLVLRNSNDSVITFPLKGVASR
jgi:hypothetical protein